MNGKLASLPATSLLDSTIESLVQETRAEYAATLRDGQPRHHGIDRIDWNLAYKKTLMEPIGMDTECLPIES